MQEYFTGIADADAVRIESSIRQGVESGWTIDQLARNIAGIAESNYKDGQDKLEELISTEEDVILGVRRDNKGFQFNAAKWNLIVKRPPGCVS